MLDFLKQWGPFAPSLLYLWLVLAFGYAFSLSLKKESKYKSYYLTQSLANLLFCGCYTFIIIIQTVQKDAAFANWVFYILYFCFPLITIITFGFFAKPVADYKLPIALLFFRRPNEQSASNGVLVPLRNNIKSLILLLSIVGIVFVTGFAGLGLRTCGWFDTALGQSGCILEIPNDDNSVYSVQFSPDGTQLAVGGATNTLKLLNSKNGALIRDLKGHQDYVMSVSFSPDGKLLASASLRGEIFLWEIDDGTIQRKITVPLNENSWSTIKVIFSPDGTKLAVGAYKVGVKIFNVANGALLREIPTPEYYYDVTFSPDGSKIATGSKGSITIWNIQDGSPLKIINSSNTEKLAFSPDGIQIASAEKFIEVWNISDGTLVQKLASYTGRITSIAFSPDGKLLASSGADDQYSLDSSSIRIWNLTEKRQVNGWKYQKTVVQSIAFSPDSKTLAAGSYGFVRLWRVNS